MVEELIKHGFVREICPYSKDVYYSYRDADYNYFIKVSEMTYGIQDQHTVHIDGNDMSTIGFAFLKSFDDINTLLVLIGEKPIKQ